MIRRHPLLALPTLLVAMFVLAFGAEAARASMHLTMHIKGAGQVQDATGRALCSSDNPNDEVVGARCELDTSFQLMPLAAIPADSPRDNWHFSSWAGDCQQPSPTSPTCTVVGHPLFPVSRSVTVRFEDHQSPKLTLLGGPQGTVLDESATFTFESDEPREGTFICRLAGEHDFELCPSGTRFYSSLSRGQHVFEVRARDASGNESESQWRYWYVDFDRDGDRYDHPGPGAREPTDCDDSDAAIYPGAREIPQNNIDEDCNRVDAPYPEITSLVRYRAKTTAGLTRISLLSVIRPPEGTPAELRCRGQGCRFSSRRRVAAPGARAIQFTRDLRNVRLRRGAVLEVRITHPGMLGKVVRISVGRRGTVSDIALCLPPGAMRPTSCSAR
jgi:hypothetical protein